MNIPDIFTNFESMNVLYLFFKAFAVLFAILYVVYSLVVLKQTQIMNNTVRSSSGSFIALISFVQLLVGLVLVLLAIFIF